LSKKSKSISDPENGVERPINEGDIVNYGLIDSDEEPKTEINNLSPSFRPQQFVSTQNSPSKFSINEAVNIGPNESVE